MKVSKLGERKLLKIIRKQTKKFSPRLLVGIGDDTAIVRPRRRWDIVYTSDVLVENIDFELDYATYDQIANKAMAANLSDIAAMGAFPKFYILTLGIPSHTSVSNILKIFKGLNHLGDKYKVTLIGGDLSEAPFLFIGLTLIGEIKPNKPILRRGGSPGDILFVTGTLGDSKAGLEILKNKSSLHFKSPKTQFLIERHLCPTPRIHEGQLLSNQNLATAMIDLSDGLLIDLLNLTEASQVGAEIFLDQLPISSSLDDYGKKQNKEPFHFALSGGEDFELLFSVSSKKIKKITKLIDSGELNAKPIGRVTLKKGIRYFDEKGKERKIKVQGYEHFK